MCPILSPDETFTLPNILKMIQNIKDWEVLGLLVGIRYTKSKFNEIKVIHEELEAQREAMITMWYETHPFASWSLLHQALSMMGETEAARVIQKEFLKGQYGTILFVHNHSTDNKELLHEKRLHNKD